MLRLQFAAQKSMYRRPCNNRIFMLQFLACEVMSGRQGMPCNLERQYFVAAGELA